jgi:hypothetical protein
MTGTITTASRSRPRPLAGAARTPLGPCVGTTALPREATGVLSTAERVVSARVHAVSRRIWTILDGLTGWLHR